MCFPWPSRSLTGTRGTVHASKELYALSGSSTEGGVDAGIPQAFYRVCTGAFARLPAKHRKTGSATRASRTPGSCRRLHRAASKPRAGTGAAFSRRGPSLAGMPELL